MTARRNLDSPTHCLNMRTSGLKALVSLALVALSAVAGASEFVLSTTTSAKDSGLLPVLIERYRAKTGVAVKVVAVGTGQAFEIARRGDADLVLAHDEAQELRFMQEGYGRSRRAVMYNDYVLIGPVSDPAKAANQSVSDAFRSIKEAQARFVTRGDNSGTHAAELRLWRAAGLDTQAFKSDWYKSVGAGMGATLNIANAMSAYTLSDRATWLKFGNRGELRMLVSGEPPLRNPYSVLTIDPRRHPHAKVDIADRFADWLVSDEGQAAIAAFRIEGQQVFFPNAAP